MGCRAQPWGQAFGTNPLWRQRHGAQPFPRLQGQPWPGSSIPTISYLSPSGGSPISKAPADKTQQSRRCCLKHGAAGAHGDSGDRKGKPQQWG